ncbi:MAG: AAA family ATPase [Nitrospirota bacterium]
MYREYFGLKELPFSIAPDPRYLYMSNQHREALAHLIYGINSEGGFVLLTGEVGTGKTTVCRCLLDQIPEDTNIAFILNPRLTVEELLATICDELGVHYPEGNTSIKVFIDNINVYLLDAHARGRKTVLIIEEAQNLNAALLEQVRLLTNLETNKHKLLQIIMLGQPELKNMLSRDELRQLAQRITARYHLGPLSKEEVAAYVNHRLSVAGARSKLFLDSTFDKLYRLSGGIPRLINLICDRALLGAYVQGKDRVDKSTLVKAASEVFGAPGLQRHRKIFKWVLASLMTIGCMVALAAIYYNYQTQPFAVVTSSPVRQASATRPIAEVQGLSQLDWPADEPIYRSKELAYQSLLKQWGVIYKSDGGSACQQAKTQGLSCLGARGSLHSLLNLNRPAVLKLFNDQGKVFYATLTAIQGQTATFIIGTKLRIVDVKDIAPRWLGDYTLLWRIPPRYQGPFKRGDRGPVVQWLDRQLTLIQGRKAQPGENSVYDDVLVRQVKKFQLSEGLTPDGIVGPQTLICLNSAAGTGDPVLIDRRKGK